MENIKRSIKLFFVYYGKLFLYIIGNICILIFIIQSANSYVIKQNEIKYSSQEYKNSIQQKENEKKEKGLISKFIQYCNTNEIDKAYDLLSDECKKEKYKTKEEFLQKYIYKFFYINICEDEILKEEDRYIIYLTQDMLITGKMDSILETKCKIDIQLEKVYIYD